MATERQIGYLYYLHGFESSPSSRKARMLAACLARHSLPIELRIPALPLCPAAVMSLLQRELPPLLDGGYRVGLIGSSLGGYYALAALQRWPELRIVTINPAVYPYRLLVPLLGPRIHPYTGKAYQLGREHLQALLDLDTPQLSVPHQQLQLLQTGDATLDYREALCRYPTSPAWIIPGGSHEFEAFQVVLPAVLSFLGLAAGIPEPGCDRLD